MPCRTARTRGRCPPGRSCACTSAVPPLACHARPRWSCASVTQPSGPGVRTPRVPAARDGLRSRWPAHRLAGPRTCPAALGRARRGPHRGRAPRRRNGRWQRRTLPRRACSRPGLRLERPRSQPACGAGRQAAASPPAAPAPRLPPNDHRKQRSPANRGPACAGLMQMSGSHGLPLGGAWALAPHRPDRRGEAVSSPPPSASTRHRDGVPHAGACVHDQLRGHALGLGQGWGSLWCSCALDVPWRRAGLFYYKSPSAPLVFVVLGRWRDDPGSRGYVMQDHFGCCCDRGDRPQHRHPCGRMR